MTGSYFIPKNCIDYWHYIPVYWEGAWKVAVKSLQVKDTQIIGSVHNEKNDFQTESGIKMSQNWFTLRRVYGIQEVSKWL